MIEMKYADYAWEQTAQLLAIDSPSGYTAKAAVWVCSAFAALGFDARITTKEFKEIPIEYVSVETVLVDRGLMLLDEETDTTVDVTLQGTRWNLARVDRDDIIIQADLASVGIPGKQTIANRPSLSGNLSNLPALLAPAHHF